MTRPALPLALLAAVACLALPAVAAVDFTPLVTSVAEPTAFVDPPDGLPHRFITRQVGDVVVWDGSSGTPNATPFLDLRDDPGVPVAQRKVLYGGERGLLAMTVHPDYASNGFFYLYYTSRDWDGGGGIGAGDIVIERYTRSGGSPEVADPASAQLILVIGHPDGNHNGGDLKFGSDGYLYVTTGDGGGGCDSTAHSGQDVNQLLGKMLRLDVDGPDAFPADPLRNYALPADNPLVGFAGLDEIWALGLRNPFRFSLDRLSGDLYIGDVGQDDWEEINRLAFGTVSPGAPVNFGWPCLEGYVDSECADPPQGCGATFTDPVRVEANSGGIWNSIMGGFLYRGGRVGADLANRYLYGDPSNGQVWAATPTFPVPPSPGWPAALLSGGEAPYGFGEDQMGELYVLSAGNSSIDCIHAVGDDCTDWAAAIDLFADGFESGDTSAWAFTVP